MLLVIILRLCVIFFLPPYVFSMEARTEYLRRKSRAAVEQTAGQRDEGETCGEAAETEHLNLFPLEDSSEKKGNTEYLREKKEDKVCVKNLTHDFIKPSYFLKFPGLHLFNIQHCQSKAGNCFQTHKLWHPLHYFAAVERYNTLDVIKTCKMNFYKVGRWARMLKWSQVTAALCWYSQFHSSAPVTMIFPLQPTSSPLNICALDASHSLTVLLII